MKIFREYNFDVLKFINEFIRWFHQFQIPNLRILFNEYIFVINLFQLANWEKKLFFDQYEIWFFFSAAQAEKNSWTKLVNQIGETIWWILYL